ncbi:MAG: hypothetical protein ABI305_07405, partial [Tepidiformaceae bacterium]
DGIAPLFRTLTADYWNPSRPGGYVSPSGVPVPPDQEVVDGIASAVITPYKAAVDAAALAAVRTHSHDIAATTGPAKEGTP